MDELEKLRERVDELEGRLAQFESKTGFMSAETMVENAQAWMNRNPRAWARMVTDAYKCVEEQRRFSVKREVENLRESGEISSDDDFRICNSYTPVFARYIVNVVPELKEQGLITMRRSKVDRLFK